MIAGVLEGDQRVRKPRACFRVECRKVVIVEDVFDVFFQKLHVFWLISAQMRERGLLRGGLARP